MSSYSSEHSSCEKQYDAARSRLQTFRLEDSRIILSQCFPKGRRSSAHLSGWKFNPPPPSSTDPSLLAHCSRYSPDTRQLVVRVSAPVLRHIPKIVTSDPLTRSTVEGPFLPTWASITSREATKRTYHKPIDVALSRCARTPETERRSGLAQTSAVIPSGDLTR